MQSFVGNLWTVGKVVSSELVVQGVSLVHHVQSWRKNRLSANAETLSPDEEIHKILNMYLPEELGEKAEKYLMNLRTDIYDILEEYDNDVRVQIYIFRNSHSFGTGSNCIVINITDSSIDMKVKINNRTQSQREPVIEDLSVVKWANTTKNVLKRMSSLNFL